MNVTADLGTNSTRNITEDSIYIGNDKLAPVVFATAFLIIFGNTATLVSIKRSLSLQTKSNAFVASLAVADLTVGFGLISYGLWLAPGTRELVNKDLSVCIFLLSTAFSAIVVSILNMLLVAIDRLVFIDHPFFYMRVVTNKLIAASIIVSWMVGLSVGNSQWFIYKHIYPPQCVATIILPEIYFKYTAPWFYFVPCFAIFGIYIKIARTAKRQREAIAKQTVAGTFHFTSAHQRKTAKSNEKSWKAAKMMMTVFGVFFLSWTPRFVLYAIASDEVNNTVPGVVFDLFLLLGLLNSGVNFLVYPLHNREFRKVFRQIFCSCLRPSTVVPAKSSFDDGRTHISTIHL
ncbi:trace amine-associated receptor 7b [Biomphalaria glabrata]|nr:trace amine-associated receptor 7b-like [Biomphalaria glabrata]KAI8783783.1 trace amine-associated receptor 7b [Biomphalaria glabrata]